jgi:hypothetical protein
MVNLPSPFGGSADDDLFDDLSAFVPDHLPEPNGFLDGHDVLTGADHVDVHTVTEELFEERGVYDMTFGYNLARLNLDSRHPNAGYRYAEEIDDPTVLRAEFTPTTVFCPQTHTLTIGSFRAWNGLAEHHDYELVRVRAHQMHHESEAINETLTEIEAQYAETGEIAAPDGSSISTTSMERSP